MEYQSKNDDIDASESPYLQQPSADLISERKRAREVFVIAASLALVVLAAFVIVLK